MAGKSTKRQALGILNTGKNFLKENFTMKGANKAATTTASRPSVKGTSKTAAYYGDLEKRTKAVRRNQIGAAAAGVGMVGAGAASAYNKRQEDKKFKNRVKDRLGIRR